MRKNSRFCGPELCREIRCIFRVPSPGMSNFSLRQLRQSECGASRDLLLKKVAAHRIPHEFAVRPQSELFEGSTSVGADGFHAQAEFRSDLARFFPCRDHFHDFVFTWRQYALWLILFDTTYQL